MLDHITNHNQVLNLNNNFSDLHNLGLDLGPIIVGEISTSFLQLMKTSALSLDVEDMHFPLNK